jgi:transcriptional regulator with XRE-family HTH domain
MPRVVLSPQSREALKLLATSIRVARKRRGWSVAELAERVGVNRATIAAVEAAQPGVAIGTVFEAAALVGVPLFSPDQAARRTYQSLKDTELALLPDAIRTTRVVDDDF